MHITYNVNDLKGIQYILNGKISFLKYLQKQLLYLPIWIRNYKFINAKNNFSGEIPSHKLKNFHPYL